MADVFLGIGSNQGDRLENLRRSLKLIEGMMDFRIIARSSLYETKPVGVSDQPDFLNCVIRGETDLDPHSLLAAMKSFEAQLGRQPNTHLKSRPIDIDILLYDNIDMESLDLVIPHTRLKTRRFVLEPMLEIAPDLVDPSTNRPFSEFLQDVESQMIIKLMDSREAFNGAGRIAET